MSIIFGQPEKMWKSKHATARAVSLLRFFGQHASSGKMPEHPGFPKLPPIPLPPRPTNATKLREWEAAALPLTAQWTKEAQAAESECLWLFMVIMERAQTNAQYAAYRIAPPYPSLLADVPPIPEQLRPLSMMRGLLISRFGIPVKEILTQLILSLA